VLARLQKRLRAGGFASFSDYLAHVESDASGDELVGLLDAIATNHTYFFREEQHFAFLTSRVVPQVGTLGGQPFRIWSMPCSSGEEPYSIAMTLADAFPGLDFSILASDLSTKALKAATAGVYKLHAVQGLGIDRLRRHFERGIGPQEGLARVNAAIRTRVSFERANLIELHDSQQRFDVVFCRNVLIYFDRAVQQRVVATLERHVKPGGYLFISHAESLNGLSHGLTWVAPAVYQRPHHG
jgi:chemotaxis protein methyltransferase CheR